MAIWFDYNTRIQHNDSVSTLGPTHIITVVKYENAVNDMTPLTRVLWACILISPIAYYVLVFSDDLIQS